MSQLARSEICFGRQFEVSEHLSAIDEVCAADVQRVGTELFSGGSLGVTVLGPLDGDLVSDSQLVL